VKLGSNVEVGYFAQDAQGLDQELSPLQFMCYECGMDTAPARDLLGRFLIEGDDVFRPIRTLSGGEKNKLALARLCYESPNLLVLDEPTNHLDMASREALAEVLQEYRGTLVLVSHDRWLLRQVTTSILDVRRSLCVVYPGSYEAYRRKTVSRGSASKTKEVPKEFAGMSPREVSKAIGQVRRSVEECEERVGSLEGALVALEAELAAPPDGADLVAMSERHEALRSQLDEAVSAWEREASILESLAALQA
jgi:ATP-binding cassette subfamily F protein 3